MADTESEQQPVAAAKEKMADKADTSGASSAAKSESHALAAAGGTEKKENRKGKEDNGSKETTGNGIRKAANADDSSSDEPILKKKEKDTPKKRLKYSVSSNGEDGTDSSLKARATVGIGNLEEELYSTKSPKSAASAKGGDEWKNYFASMCWECKQKRTWKSCERCRKEKEHIDCDWRNNDRAPADQQGRGAEGTSKHPSPLKSRSTPGGDTARRQHYGNASARGNLCYTCRVFTFFFLTCTSTRFPLELYSLSIIEAVHECVVRRALCPITLLTHLDDGQL